MIGIVLLGSVLSGRANSLLTTGQTAVQRVAILNIIDVLISVFLLALDVIPTIAHVTPNPTIIVLLISIV